MDGPGAGGGHADAGLVAELREPDRFEGGHLLVTGLDEARLVVRTREGAQDPVDPVAGVAEDLLDTPLPQSLQQLVGNGRHVVLLSSGFPARRGWVPSAAASTCARC